jgi:hypothetical protein
MLFLSPQCLRLLKAAVIHLGTGTGDILTSEAELVETGSNIANIAANPEGGLLGTSKEEFSFSFASFDR